MDIKKILCDSIIELLEHNTIDRIAVQDILEKSGVSRAIFYKYFKDKLDLMMYPLFLFIERDLKSSNTVSLEFYIRLFQFMEKNQSFFKNAFISEGQNSYGQELSSYGAKVFEKAYTYVIGKDAAELTAEDKYWMEFYSSGAFAVVKRWVESGMKESPQMIGQLIYNCMPAALRIH